MVRQGRLAVTPEGGVVRGGGEKGPSDQQTQFYTWATGPSMRPSHKRGLTVMLMDRDAAEVHVAEVLYFLQHGNGEGRRTFAVVGWMVPLEGGPDDG